ncbi:3-hydroxyisobutyrate dehydrogenase, mitochondrial [Hypsibius exemplaris]|uniref:3-hydroxyisobutyrate dehydrogenase n=1 Tax=Hypsibius exemplaris TaxID=2072580 RepID=A0A1W0WUE2_HYPEX|nr:3-hydroxyisobutyrate dehydrogenase, mitochondrial [Hypsibius exemplaris]
MLATRQLILQFSHKYVRTLATQAGKSRVGFIGLGNMGTHMAQNLIKNGHSLVVHDVYPEAVARLEALGATAARSASEVAESCDRIITMLPSSPHVLQVYNCDSGLLKNVRPGTLLIDSSTIDPATTKEIAAKADAKGATFVDAPVSGGVGGAKDATLTFMVGCEEAKFAGIKTLLLHMGKNVVHCGGVGMGEAAKICNNMLMAISMVGVAETMNLGTRLGLDSKVLAGIINTSSGRCWSSDTYNPVPGIKPGTPSCNNYDGGFVNNLMAKDLGLAQNASTATMSPTPMGSLAHQLYRILITKGYGGKDFSSIYQFFQEGLPPVEPKK